MNAYIAPCLLNVAIGKCLLTSLLDVNLNVKKVLDLPNILGGIRG